MGVEAASPRYAWFLLGFLTLLNVVNFVDRQLIASLQVWVKRDLGLVDWQIGLLVGYVFVLFYTLVGVFLGTVADRWNRPRLIALGLTLWSLLTAATGLAQNFTHLAAARVLVGVGEATLTPAAIAMLCNVFPARWHARAAGIYYLGIPVGAGISLMVSGALGPDLGWRNCFFLLGSLGLLLVLVTWVLPDPPRGGTIGSGERDASGVVAGAESSTPRRDARTGASKTPPRPHDPGASTRELFGTILHALSHSPALALTLAGAMAVLFSISAATYDVSWLVRERGFTDRQAPFFLGGVFLLGGSAGNVLGGWLGDVFQRRWVAGRLLFLAAAQAVLTPLALAYRLVPADSVFFPAACFCAAVSVTFFYGPIFSTVQALVPGRVRSTMLALLLFALNFLGHSPGLLVSAQLSAYLGYTRGLFAVTSVGLLSVPLFLLAARSYAGAVVGVREGETRRLALAGASA